MEIIDAVQSFLSSLPWWVYLLAVILIIAALDVFQKKHTIKHNFPVVGHLRYMLEKIGPELRQYIVANNREELPFNRSQRSWVYASSKNKTTIRASELIKINLLPTMFSSTPACFPTPCRLIIQTEKNHG